MSAVAPGERMKVPAARTRMLRLGSAGGVIVFSLVLVAMIWISVAVQLAAEREAAVDNARRQTESFARVFEEHVRRTLRSAELALRHVGVEYAAAGSRLDLAAFVHRHVTQLDPFTIFSLVDERGNLVLASYPFKPTSYADRESFRHHASRNTREVYISRPQIGTITGTPSIYLSRRLNKPDGRFDGVLAVGLDTRYFSSFYDQVGLGPDSVVVLVGHDGIVRARKKNDDYSVGQDLSGFESFQALRQQRDGHFTAERTLDGVRRIFAYRVMNDYPLIVQVGMAESEMLAAYARMRAQFVAWAGLITALLVLFAALVTAQSRSHRRYAGALAASESRYRSFITATSRIVRSTDALGRAREDSPTWRAYTGQGERDYLERGWMEAVHPEDRARTRAAWDTAAQNDAPFDAEFRVRGADGEYRAFHCRTAPVLAESGKVKEWVSVLDDLSEMKKAEAAVRESEARLRAIWTAEPECVQLLDRNGAFLDVNPAGLAMLEAGGLEQVRGRRLTDHVSAQHAAQLEEAVAAVFRGEARALTFELVGAAGGRRWMDMRCVPLRDGPQGRGIVALLGVARDITEEKRTRDDLIAARTRELESANKELASFSYSVSHDLRAPVRAIEGFAALVLSSAAGRVDAETLDRLQRIRANAHRMGMLIDDLLRLSRVSQRELDRRDFDLSALARAVVADLRRTEPHRVVDVVIADGITTYGDPALVQLVLENLIGNAWKFTSRTAGARVEIGEQVEGGAPVYFVRDNGAGFDMQYADKLFNAFQRLHHREDFEGTGIGLSIVHRVVAKHGGRVWTEARVNQGATFYFTLQ